MKKLLITVLRFGLPLVVVAAGAIAAALLIRSRTLPQPTRDGPRPRLVRAITVHHEPVTLHVRSQGTVRPKTETTLVAQVGGTVLYVSPALASGGFFAKGERLLEIERRDYELALVQAQARLAQAERLLAIEEREASLAIAEWKREVPGVEPDPLAAHEPQLKEARANVAAARAAIDKAELDLARTTITAPYAGRASNRFVDVGQVVMPGSQLALVHDTSLAEVRAPLPDAQLAYLDLPRNLGRPDQRNSGPPARLHTTFAGSPREWTGHVARIEGEVDPRTRMVHLVIEVADPYARRDDTTHPPLPVGLFVEVEIEGKRLPGVITLPRVAVRGEDIGYVVDGESRLRARSLSILKAERDQVLVDGGLADGDRVCISPIETFVEGMPVEIAAPAAGASGRSR